MGKGPWNKMLCHTGIYPEEGPRKAEFAEYPAGRCSDASIIFGILYSWFKALGLHSLMIAYEIIANQSRAFCMFPPFLPQLQVPYHGLFVAAEQMWLQGNPLLLAHPPGANYCFPGLNCSGTVHWPKSLPAKALMVVEAWEGKGQAWEPGCPPSLAGWILSVQLLWWGCLRLFLHNCETGNTPQRVPNALRQLGPCPSVPARHPLTTGRCLWPGAQHHMSVLQGTFLKENWYSCF